MTDKSASTSRSVDSNLFITVSGPPGCGATTLCDGLSEALNCGYVSGGDIFRDLADERGMSLSQLIAKSDETDDIDRALDRRLRTIAEKWGAANNPFILEARLAGWLAGNRADLRIWLDAPDEVRVDRTSDRKEMEAEMRVREVSEAGRYKSYYNVDVSDQSFYDLSVNTARWGKDATLKMVLTAIDEYEPTGDEGAFKTDDIAV
ncbi:(d)CMP kinase [Haloquadratum walsbyi]|jgi:cytidylate kinase, putative|uniref:Cytidylate kinase n=1 Tax=Haloquadratum walsbyi J07HQW2 TaxID=1238425 RepID=U1PRI7_9EURY|nr:AAA family ATPase [Haloquadratum walsbyi]ERG94951.1 MAG: cytidylate kinase, putative [Haloquadratum walsbyi J07HQW2]